MKGVSGFNGSGAASGSFPAAEVVVVVEKDYVGLSEAAASYATTMKGVGGVAVADEGRGDEGEEEEELELGLSLGAKKVTGGGTRASPWREYCRILTAKDFPPLGSRASPRSSSASSVSSSSATLGDGGGAAAAGSKRPADSVASDVGGSGSPPSQVVVGWPPIRAFRMNTLVNQSKDSFSDSDTCSHKKDNSNNGECIGSKDHGRKGGHVGGSRFVKVNMDGDPIGRKVDLNAHLSYQTLSLALEIMFQKPAMSLGNPANGTKASKLLDGSSDFALTYEDKDGDWMLVGDVPWGMFVYTVKRLRIMRNSDANGLEPWFQAPFDKSAGLIRSKPT